MRTCQNTSIWEHKNQIMKWNFLLAVRHKSAAFFSVPTMAFIINLVIWDLQFIKWLTQRLNPNNQQKRKKRKLKTNRKKSSKMENHPSFEWTTHKNMQDHRQLHCRLSLQKTKVYAIYLYAASRMPKMGARKENRHTKYCL